jgi:antitoxin VapB
MEMKMAKIFRHGNSQAVRLPKDFRFDATEVVIEKAGDVVLLIPKRHSATNLKEALDGFKGQIDRAQPDAAEERNW